MSSARPPDPGLEPIDGLPAGKPGALDFPLTDLGNAERLVAEHGRDLRYAVGLGWLAWDGRRWKPDRDGEALRRAKLMVRSIYARAAELDGSDDRKRLTKHAVASESESRLRAAVKLAESDLAVIVEAKHLNADPLLFNAANGTIDLRTGELREHARADLMTRITGAVYRPDAHSGLWESSVSRATGGDEELAGFLQRAVGYSMTGLTSEDKLFFAHGPTATAKSSLLEAVKAALGEYAMTADFEMFLKRRGEAGIKNDLARLDGARFVISIEVDEGKQLAEGVVKMLTGGDTVVARFLYHESFEFHPVFTLWLAANERPRVNADDDAMWRRILQIPFVHQIPPADRDERVKLKLRTDPDVQSAILTWAVQGCLKWQQLGLAAPALVRDYTDEYRAENDPLRDFLTDICALGPEQEVVTADLRAAYDKWTHDSGEKAVGVKAFASKLKARGCTPAKDPAGRRTWRGITLREHSDSLAQTQPAEPASVSGNFSMHTPHEEVLETGVCDAEASSNLDPVAPEPPNQGQHDPLANLATILQDTYADPRPEPE